MYTYVYIYICVVSQLLVSRPATDGLDNVRYAFFPAGFLQSVFIKSSKFKRVQIVCGLGLCGPL